MRSHLLDTVFPAAMVLHRATDHRTQDRADGADGSAGTATAVDVEREDDSSMHTYEFFRESCTSRCNARDIESLLHIAGLS